MHPNPPGNGQGPSPSGPGPDRKGSVKRARQLLEAGVRPTQISPPQPLHHPSPVRNAPAQGQWPLPDSGLPVYPMHHHARFLLPRGPPPQRPPRPNEVPSPSIYSEKRGQEMENDSAYTVRSARSFSLPQVHTRAPPPRPSTNDGSCASPTSTVDMAPRISIATEELFRQSTTSSTVSIPGASPFPPPPEPPLPPIGPQRRTAGLVAPPNVRQPPRARRSSVSPIPEEISDPRHTLGSFASSRAIPSSWGSGVAESEILGAYLDVDSDDERPRPSLQDDPAMLVRNASLGKRGKPTMRTISKSNPTSEVCVPDTQPGMARGEPTNYAGIGAIGMGAMVSQTLYPPTPLRRGSASTASSDNSKGVDPEKPPITHHDEPYRESYEKEIKALPRAAPTMSDKRPGGRKPPQLDIEAVRGAEARGSLSSLSDLIRRATKLASNLDRGKTASRADLAGDADFRAVMGNRGRNSGSLSDILASFPPPGLTNSEGRSSWPVFFGRSNLRNAEPLGSNEDDPHAARRKRHCCGMPLWLFILLCIVISIIILLAILLPVLLVAVPRHQASSQPSCLQTTSCQNGGASVSSGKECSCVCANGYTGSQCTIASDDSCVTTQIKNSKNATTGSALPSLFTDAEKFSVPLDPVTVMALFSLANSSCKTENALVAFSGLDRGDSGKSRRSIKLPVDPPASREDKSASHSSDSSNGPTPVLAGRALATLHGILYDDSGPGKMAEARAAPVENDSTTTKTSVGASSTTHPAASTAMNIPDEVVEFSQVAVLYMLQKTGSFNSAQDSQESIQSYLTESYPKATHPSLELFGFFEMDFENKTITLSNNTGTG